MKSISLKVNLKEIKSVVINGVDKAKGTVASGVGVAGDAIASGASTVAEGVGVSGDAIAS